MAEQDLQPGSIFRRDGEDFIIIDSHEIQMKEAQDARWSPAIMFQRADRTGPRLVRSQDDFLAKYRAAEGA